MTWMYEQSDGSLFRDGRLLGQGYSGAGRDPEGGRNNGDMQNVVRKGPIPRGAWRIGRPVDGTHMGPMAIPLMPADGTDTFGRSGFYIHGNNAADNASEGCVIIPGAIRTAILQSGDTRFVVYP